MQLWLEFRNDGLIGTQCDHGEWREENTFETWFLVEGL